MKPSEADIVSKYNALNGKEVSKSDLVQLSEECTMYSVRSASPSEAVKVITTKLKSAIQQMNGHETALLTVAPVKIKKARKKKAARPDGLAGVDKLTYKVPYKDDGSVNFPESKGKKGVYVIKVNNDIVYIGYSGYDLYKTLYRHFQKWNDPKQVRVSYAKWLKKKNIKVGIIYTDTEAEASNMEKALILKYQPKDNPNKLKKYTPSPQKKTAIKKAEKKAPSLKGVDPDPEKKESEEKPSANKEEILKARQSGVMNLGQVHDDDSFKVIDWKYPWDNLIGKACTPIKIFVMGPGGTGKSGNMLKFSDDLTRLGYKVLYVSGEQFGTPTFQQLVKDTGVKNEKITVVGSINEDDPLRNPGNYDFIVLDSKDDMNIDVTDFEALVKKYPQQSFIVLSQSNKDGSYSGKGKWRNVVDTMLECYERGKIRTAEKNRWGGYGDENIFGEAEELQNEDENEQE